MEPYLRHPTGPVQACHGRTFITTTNKTCTTTTTTTTTITIIIKLLLLLVIGGRGGTVVKALCYKSEGRWFDSRWCHWNFSLT